MVEFYTPWRWVGGDVVELTPSNFDTLVMKGHEVWMVEFYAPRLVIVPGGGGGGRRYVVELTPSNFDQLVMKGDKVWMVEFYPP